MTDLNWVKELVRFEQDMEESGMVDFSAGFDPDKELIIQSVTFMNDLKETIIKYVSTFNDLKANGLGGIKVYGISNTQADFMLFRNGFKLIFELEEPGKVSITTNHQASSFVPGTEAGPKVSPRIEEDHIIAKWGAFGELVWTYKGQDLNIGFLCRYYLSKFVRESAK